MLSSFFVYTRNGRGEHSRAENPCKKATVGTYETLLYNSFFFAHFYIPASGQTVVTGGVGSCLHFLSRIGSSNPIDLTSIVANSCSRVIRKTICAQERVPTNLYEYALEGIRAL